MLALERAPIPAGMWVSAEEDGVSLRSYGRLTLMCGVPHRTGEGRGSAYAELDRRAAQMFGSCRTVAHWSAQDCITASGKPYIGRFCLARPNWMVATGFGKWGMTSSMVASRIITELICDRPCRWRNLYAPSSASFSDLGGIAKELAHATKGLARVALSIPSESVDALPPGHGGVVFLNGKRAGVYKELDGKVHAVRPVCPHLGCLLEWNDDEKTWDCPCHGSRFDYRGRLIDTPARHDLKEI